MIIFLFFSFPGNPGAYLWRTLSLPIHLYGSSCGSSICHASDKCRYCQLIIPKPLLEQCPSTPAFQSLPDSCRNPTQHQPLNHWLANQSECWLRGIQAWQQQGIQPALRSPRAQIQQPTGLFVPQRVLEGFHQWAPEHPETCQWFGNPEGGLSWKRIPQVTAQGGTPPQRAEKALGQGCVQHSINIY